MKVDLPHGYWNPRVELVPREELRELQLKRLNQVIRFAWDNSPFYHRLMTQHGITPKDIVTLEDFSKKFPITRREDVDKDHRCNQSGKARR